MKDIPPDLNTGYVAALGRESCAVVLCLRAWGFSSCCSAVPEAPTAAGAALPCALRAALRWACSHFSPANSARKFRARPTREWHEDASHAFYGSWLGPAWASTLGRHLAVPSAVILGSLLLIEGLAGVIAR